MDGPSAQLPERCITVSTDHAISSTKSAAYRSKDSANQQSPESRSSPGVLFPAGWKRAAQVAELFNRRRLRGFVLQELQLDEIRTFLDRKKRPIWIITGIEVWSRLWPSCVLGRRNYRNIRKLLRDLLGKSELIDPILITTDSFGVYEWIIRRMFGPTCIYAQVIKTRRKNRGNSLAVCR